MKGFQPSSRVGGRRLRSCATSVQRGLSSALWMWSTSATVMIGPTCLSKLIMFLHAFHGCQHFQGMGVIGGGDIATDLSNFAKDSAPIVCRCSSTVAIEMLSLHLARACTRHA